ncbi:type IV pilin N-terminal domain-containing protein [Halomicroarcula sp. GCM10025324]|uniref:type IV pilin N-terminal domain-containing protein n=1 Tax=Haloarcula TaxID=2237 RepID=UPI0023E771E3|nr:type IV pilin N-terminal domain-containing protein [Halomicroarcula sp. ZS-22-S1]
MNPKQLIHDDDAVSPVIGVILMVAITVILAAVIATFVLGLGDQVSNTAPQASFSFDYSSSGPTLDITHDGGDTIQGSELYVVVDGSRYGWDSGALGGGSEVSAGNSVTVTNADESLDASSKVRVVYEAAEGGNSATLGEWEGPQA